MANFQGGSAIPVYIISDSQLVENGGNFKVLGRVVTPVGVADGTLTPAQEAWLVGAVAQVPNGDEIASRNVGGSAGDLTVLDGDGNAVASGYVIADFVPTDASVISKSANYELAAGDEAKIIECDGTFVINCPDGLDTGFQVVIVNIGVGTITITADTTLQSKNAAVTLPNQYGMATVYHRGSNIWLLAGDLA